MSRDLEDENYYVSHGGKVPVKWTAPEVGQTNPTELVYTIARTHPLILYTHIHTYIVL